MPGGKMMVYPDLSPKNPYDLQCFIPKIWPTGQLVQDFATIHTMLPSGKSWFTTLRQTNMAMKHDPFVVDIPTRRVFESPKMGLS